MSDLLLLRQVLAAHRDQLLAIPGVLGTGIGCKVTGGKLTDDLCLMVLVEAKRPLAELEETARIPTCLGDPPVPTDVVDFKHFPGRAARGEAAAPAVGIDRRLYDPLPGGCAIGTVPDTPSGTLGAIFHEAGTGRLLGLTSRTAAPGVVGSAVHQPCPDQSQTTVVTQIGRLIHSLDTTRVNAAIVTIENRPAELEVLSIGNWNGTGAARVNADVRKHGAGTGLTTGYAVAVDFSFKIGGHQYDDLIVIVNGSGRFSDAGDAGACVFNAAGEMVGVIFITEAELSFTLACSPREIEQELKIAIDSDDVQAGYFTTTTVHPDRDPAELTSHAVSYSESYSAPPRLALGLNSVYMSHLRNVNVIARTSGETKQGFTIHLDGLQGCEINSAACSWLKIAPEDTAIQCGTYYTPPDVILRVPHLSHLAQFTFERPFTAPPTVIVWLNMLSLDSRTNWRIHAHPHTVNAQGFSVLIKTRDDSVVYGAGITWVAFPAGSRHIRAGNFSTLDVHPWQDPQKETSRAVKFDPPFGPVDPAMSPPRAITGLNALDIDRDKDIRIRNYVTDLDYQGLTWHIDTWDKTTLYSAEGAYIVIVE